MPTLTLPNGVFVSHAWIAHNTSIPASAISRSLPAATDTNPRTWERFLTARGLPAGVPNVHITERRGTIVQLDAWAAKAGSAKPLWGVAWNMVETIRQATFRDNQQYGKPLDMPVAGFQTCRVFAAYLTTEPVEVEGDPSGYARVTCDLAVDWTV